MGFFLDHIHTSMEPCIVRILHNAEYITFWILWHTIQGPTVIADGKIFYVTKNDSTIGTYKIGTSN